jgi:hypothetical protein
LCQLLSTLYTVRNWEKIVFSEELSSCKLRAPSLIWSKMTGSGWGNSSFFSKSEIFWPRSLNLSEPGMGFSRTNSEVERKVVEFILLGDVLPFSIQVK